MDDQNLDREALLARLIQAVRNVAAISQLGQEQLADAIEDWDDVLIEVPTARLASLRQAGLRCKLKTAGEFRDLFQAQEAEGIERAHNAARQRQDAQWQARAESGELRAGPGYRAAMWQCQRWKAGLLAVTCECLDSKGHPLNALFDDAELNWVCASGRCAFTWPISDTMGAPSRGTVGPLGRALGEALAEELS